MLPSHLKECDLFQLQIKQELVLPHILFPQGAAWPCRIFDQQFQPQQHPQEPSLHGSHPVTRVLTGQPVLTSKLQAAGDFLTLRSPGNCSWEDFVKQTCSACPAFPSPVTKSHCGLHAWRSRLSSAWEEAPLAHLARR